MAYQITDSDARILRKMAARERRQTGSSPRSQRGQVLSPGGDPPVPVIITPNLTLYNTVTGYRVYRREDGLWDSVGSANDAVRTTFENIHPPPFLVGAGGVEDVTYLIPQNTICLIQKMPIYADSFATEWVVTQALYAIPDLVS